MLSGKLAYLDLKPAMESNLLNFLNLKACSPGIKNPSFKSPIKKAVCAVMHTSFSTQFNWFKFDVKRMRFSGIPKKIDFCSEASSAFPNSVNVESLIHNGAKFLFS